MALIKASLVALPSFNYLVIFFFNLVLFDKVCLILFSSKQNPESLGMYLVCTNQVHYQQPVRQHRDVSYLQKMKYKCIILVYYIPKGPSGILVLKETVASNGLESTLK